MSTIKQGSARLCTLVKICIIFIQYSCGSGTMNGSELIVVRECTHQKGYKAYKQGIYECTILGEGATLWKGGAFNCPETDNEIVLLHSINSTVQRNCNNGAITGRIIHAKGSSYTSQLIVNISSELTGSDITCAYDSGEQITVIGSLNITSVFQPAPNDVQVMDMSTCQLSFRWSDNSTMIYYSIVKSSCEQCSESDLMFNTIDSCIGNCTQVVNYHLEKDLCVFALQHVACDGTLTPEDIMTFIVTVTGSVVEGQVISAGKKTEDASIGPTQGVIIAASVVSLVILMGITLALGLVLVCFMSKKCVNLHSNNMKPRPTHNVGAVTENSQQRMGIYSLLQSPENDHENNVPESNIIYAEISPRIAPTNSVNIDTLIPLQEERTQYYAEITHNSEPSAETTITNKLPVNRDLLLILLTKEMIPRWHEFGILIGMPKEVMDNYSESEYTAEQCILEIADYWLRHYPGRLTWNNVAQKLNEMKLHNLAEKALQISATGCFPIEIEIDNDFQSHQLQLESDWNHQVSVDNIDVYPPTIPPNYVVTNIGVPEEVVQPPPLPPKS